MAQRAWSHSLYWRIAIGFVACVALLLVAQALVIVWLASREGAPLLSGSPRRVAAVVASDVSAALEADPNLDVANHLARQFGDSPFRIFVVFEDGRVVSNGDYEPPPQLVRVAHRRLRAWAVRRGGPMSEGPTGVDDQSPRRPSSTAIVAGGRVIGLAFVLPAGPPLVVALRVYGPSVVATGLVLLFIGTAAISFFVFTPARRRLAALERAAEAIGRGETGVRAPESGGDEVAGLAQAFNRMAGELERRMRELEESDRSRRQLLADVSHELMTPLTAMRGYLETLAMPGAVRSQEDRDRYLRIVTEETERLEAIIGDLLDLARLEGGAQVLSREPVPVNALFARAGERHEGVLRARGITLDVSIESGTGFVWGDERRLEQVVQNLMANAVRHTPPGGRVSLSATRDGDCVRMRVRDSGPGIPAEHLPRVFDRFYRVDAARDSASGGSGLGLSIVRAIVERLGGRVSVTSEPGQGACFEVVLDAADPPPAAQPHERRPTSDAPPHPPAPVG